MFGSTGLLIFLPAALAACLIVACPLKRWTRRATATVSSSIWPEWLPRPAESTALAFVEESPLLQPLPASQPELLLIIPVSVPSPGIVAQALTGVGLVVQPILLDDCEGTVRLKGHHRLLGVWAPAELLERKAEQLRLPMPLHSRYGGGTVEYSPAVRPLLERRQLGDFSSLQRQVLILALAGPPRQLRGHSSLDAPLRDWATAASDQSQRFHAVHAAHTHRETDATKDTAAAEAAAAAAAAGSAELGAGADELSAGLALDRMVHEGTELAAYVVTHDAAELATLRRSWLGEALAPQPLHAIRAYFGVQVALYFAWLGSYTRLLSLLALASAPVLVARLTLGADNALMPFYALLLVLVTSGWHQLWRRTLVSHTSTWGAEIEPNEATIERPDYRAELTRHPASGELVRSAAPPWHARLRTIAALQGTLLLGVAALVVALQLLLLKGRLRRQTGLSGQACGSMLHGGFIAVSNWAYFQFALWLTRWENHRSHAHFEVACKQVMPLYPLTYSTHLPTHVLGAHRAPSSSSHASSSSSTRTRRSSTLHSARDAGSSPRTSA